MAPLDSNSGAALWLARVWSAGFDPAQLNALASAVDRVDAAAVQRYSAGIGQTPTSPMRTSARSER